ncbi:MAG TPA: ATP-grasp domain-containing protein [Gemmatimonadaceae bacterium]|nr:ATP-grasp domain-containing protein [Gemmatimonadaceae bacterium]
MRIALLYDGDSVTDATPDLLIIQTVEAIETALQNEGNTVVRVPVGTDARWIDRVRRGRFDAAFNMCEGVDGVAELEPPVISVLELFGLPYTGSSSYTAALCLRKPVVNALLAQSGLPVPAWITLRRGSRIRSVGYPAIVKPAAEDASIGVEQRSVVRSARALKARVEAMLQTFDEVIVQRYIQGRELNVGIVGDTVLPIAEIDFSAMPKGLWRMVTYRSKWDTGSDEDLGAQPKCPAELPARVATEVRRVAAEAWRLVAGQGYGRVDMRLDETGQPWILEVNSNPDIAPDAGLARMARAAGIEYSTLVRTITELGLARKRDQQPQYEQWVLAQQLSGMQVAASPELELFAGGNR